MSSSGWPGIPLMIEPRRPAALRTTTLLMLTRRIAPTGGSSGPRRRLPRRMKIGELQTSRMVMLEIVTSSMIAPSTLSIARPRQSSKTQLEIVMFLKPPLDSVPNLMRPVCGDLPCRGGSAVNGAVEQRAFVVVR